ncbi:hypothetical protein ACHAWO_005509 [Cyclotella atomus]|uniref:Kinesin motor domain-containing protein n=1 Tax=Cyclotella atomus TaxID=382360 RepID=A0ABD3NUG2_9STRA
MATNIQVAVRVRPFLPFEAGSKSCIDVFSSSPTSSSSSSSSHIGNAVKIHHHNKEGHTFTFDKCFGGSVSQVELYESVVVPLLNSCLEGYNATTLAYGQTGAGKTYTTLGPATSPDFFKNQKHTPEHDAVGILPRALRDLFHDLEQKRNSTNSNSNPASETESDILDETINISKSPIRQQSSSTNNNNTRFEYQVKLQFLELYGEEIRDLLSTSTTQKIVIRDSAGDSEAIGATEVPVSSAQEAMVCLTRGMLRRVTGATAMNAESSRSHAIMCVMIEQITRSEGEDGEEAVVVQRSKFNFVDLAGCERAKRTHAKGQRLKEGININKGLLVLGNVISALGSGDKSKFVPFRDSKLTRLLRGSLGGNHKTLMIACASPSHKNAEESLNCLRYANRAKNIQNMATVNVDPHSKLVNALRDQVEALAGELLRLCKSGGGKVDNERFPIDLLLVLIKGGKEAQNLAIGSKSEDSSKESTSGVQDELPAPVDATAMKDLTAELEKTRLSLKEAKRDLAEKTEQLEAVVTDRDKIRRTSEMMAETPAKAFSAATPSKAMGVGRNESIHEILTTLSDAADNDMTSPEANGQQNGASSDESNAELNAAKVKINKLSTEVQTLRGALVQSKAALDMKNTELESTLEELVTALEEGEMLRERVQNTADIDLDTIHYIVRRVASFGDNRNDNFQSEAGDEESVLSSTSSSEESKPANQEETERLSTFSSAMFSTGKFLVDRNLYQDSIPCFEVVLEVRRQLYGWDDSLVGDALHMEGFVRSKMGDYDRALMLLWDALRIRKISSEPLKISATLRLLADLHFSKEENMHAALFYEECARHLKEHDMSDPHLPLVLIDLARTKDRLGEYRESMSTFEEALSLYERSLDHDDDRVASLQYEMGVLAFQIGDRVRGEACFKNFIRIRKSKGSDLDEGVANALFVLGSLHWAMKKKDLALDCWTEALDIFVGLGRPDDDAYVKSLREKIVKAQKRPLGRLFRG